MKRRRILTALVLAIVLGAGLLALSLERVPSTGGSLVIALAGGSRTLNPLLATTDPDEAATSLVFTPLVRLNLQGRLVPNLARSISASADGTRFVLQLRGDVFWQGGEPVTSADAAYTFHQLANPNAPWYDPAWRHIRISTPSARTIVFSLPHPDFTFLQRLTIGIVPRSLPFDPAPISDGEYRVGPVTRFGMVLTARRHDVARPAFLERLVLRARGSTTPVQALTCSEQFGAPLRPGAIPTADLIGLAFNEATITQPRLRRVLLEMVQQADRITFPLAPTYPLYGSSNRVSLPLSPGRFAPAKQIIRLAAPTGAAFTPIVSTIARTWRGMSGLRVRVTRMPFAALIKMVLVPGAFDAVVLDWDFGNADYNPAAFWDTTAPLNFARYHDPVVDHLGTELPLTPSLTARNQLRRDIAHRLEADAAGIGLAAGAYVCNVPPGLHGFRSPLMATNAGDLFADEPEWYLSTHWSLQNPLARLHRIVMESPAGGLLGSH